MDGCVEGVDEGCMLGCVDDLNVGCLVGCEVGWDDG